MTSPYTPEELAARRETVDFNRANYRLSGIETPPDLMELEERYCRGELSNKEFRHACYQRVWETAPNKNWRPESDPSWEPIIR